MSEGKKQFPLLNRTDGIPILREDYSSFLKTESLAKQAAAVLQEQAGRLSRLELRVDYKNTYVEEPFALVQILSPRTGYGPPEERLVRGDDTAEAMYRNVISTYGTPQQTGTR